MWFVLDLVRVWLLMWLCVYLQFFENTVTVAVGNDFRKRCIPSELARSERSSLPSKVKSPFKFDQFPAAAVFAESLGRAASNSRGRDEPVSGKQRQAKFI